MFLRCILLIITMASITFAHAGTPDVQDPAMVYLLLLLILVLLIGFPVLKSFMQRRFRKTKEEATKSEPNNATDTPADPS